MRTGHETGQRQSRIMERKTCRQNVRYALASGTESPAGDMQFDGSIVDFSSRGVGIETDGPLAPGHTLWLLDGQFTSQGTVRWCRETTGSYRSGVEFPEQVDAGRPASCRLQPTLDEQIDPSRRLLLATEDFLARLSSLEDAWSAGRGNAGELEPRIAAAFDDVLTACAAFERTTNDIETVRQARRWFHEKTDEVLGKSRCIQRCRTWPQGHQGDYKTLEIVYRDTPLSHGFGSLLDRVALNTMLARAVRGRIRKLSGYLAEELSARTEPSVLNIACGSCRELLGAVPEIVASSARVTCIDSDGDSLDFALERLSNCGADGHFTFRKYNALRMFDAELNAMEFGAQDVIYSLGLFDYLPSDFLAKLFRSLYALLNPGGTFIAAFKDADRYRHQDYHWIFDWDGFLQRNGADFREILDHAGIPADKVSEERDETGIIVFYRMHT
ncbi:MAG: hypothetical protein OHK006_21530 [Thermodesulfovibrionales bacterium]